MSRQVAALLANLINVTQIRDRLHDGVTYHTPRMIPKDPDIIYRDIIEALLRIFNMSNNIHSNIPYDPLVCYI